MLSNFKKLLFIVFLIGIADLSIVYAQQKPVVFEKFTTRDGLSQNKVFSITQDQDGFIWIGTEDGLNRFDGYDFKIFRSRSGDSLAITDNYVKVCYTSKSGTLWFGTEYGGLNRFNADAQNFTSYRHDHTDANTITSNYITTIHEDNYGNLWLGSNRDNFDYFDLKNERFVHASNLLPQGFEIEDGIITFIHHDKNNRLWVGGINKLYVFQVNYNSKSLPLLSPVLTTSNPINRPASIHENEDGKIWIGCFDGILFEFDPESEMFHQFRPNNQPALLDGFALRAMEEGKDGRLWISAFRLGLVQIDPETGNASLFQHAPLLKTSLSQNLLIALFVDRTGILWGGTEFAGLNTYDPTLVKFALYRQMGNTSHGFQAWSLRGFLLDEKNRIWISSSGKGLYVLDRNTGQMINYVNSPSNPNSISSNVIRSLYQDRGGVLWIGTANGLNKLLPNRKTFKHFYLGGSPGGQVNYINYKILEVPGWPGYLWFGTNDGLIRFDKKSAEYKKYTYDPESETSLNNRDNDVRTLFWSEKRPDELWLGTTHGINIFNPDTERFKYYVHDKNDPKSLSHDNVIYFFEDDQGIVWIGTYGGGLNRFDPETGQFSSYREYNSDLPNDAVYAALPDKEGNLWLSTNKGISKFNPEEKTFRNYTVDDGLQSEEYNNGSYYMADDGELFFGGLEGFNSFFPEQVSDNTFKPQLAITDFKIFNESVPIAEDSPLHEHVNRLSDITLDYWQNDISFEYVALHFTRSAKNQYAIKLDNYDKDWRYVGNTRKITYTNLDPGEYTFRVIGSNSDGVWNEDGKSVRLIINPPWWETNYAYISYVLLFISLILGIDRFQRFRVTRKEQEKAKLALLEAENERKSKELEEARQLQLSMLPKQLPTLPNLDIAVYMQTATEVGGDYYDFHVGMDGTLTVVIGDATGHGMKAGTMVTTTKSLFNSYAPNPDILFSFQEITRCIKQMNFDHLSMCMTMLKIQGNKMTMSAAGMPPSFIYKRETQSIEEHLLKGMPLGTMKKFKYELKDTVLQPGDTILLISDGLPELKNKQEEMFGYKSIRNAFEEIAEKSPEEIIKHLKSQGSDWMENEEPDDDVTLVVIKMK